MTTAQVPARPLRTAPLPGRGKEPERRPPLRIVRAGELSARARRRRNRLVVGTAGALVVAGLFALVAFHVMVTQAQFRLDKMDRRAADQQARYQRLRLQVAQLESPDRIVAAAQERLGMVPPPGVTYLSPAGATTDAAQPGPSSPSAGGGAKPTASRSLRPPPADGTAAADSPVSGGWAQVKSELAAGR
jgi:cell division protein FtsL